MVSERGGKVSIKEPEAREALRQDVLEQLITLELLAQEADRLDVQVDAGIVERRIQETEGRLGGKDALDRILSASGSTREEFVAEQRRSLRIQRLIQQQVRDTIKVDPKEVKSFYESNPEVFEKPEEVRARHIVIRVSGDATDEKRKEAKEALEKAADRIKGGEAFEAIAREISQDATASTGGDLGYFSRGQMVPQLEKVAFAMEEGQVSQMVESRLGYHLIKVEDKRPPRPIPLEEAEPKIAAYLKRKKLEEGVRDYIEALRAKAKIEKTSF